MSGLLQPDNVDRELVDFAVLGEWMETQGLAAGVFENVEPIGGGTQNIMLRFTRGGREFVLRRPPKHLRPQSNDVLRRESRLLAALYGSAVAAPGLIAECSDESVLGGAVFYLMEPVTGFSPAVTLPLLHKSDERIRHCMGLEASAGIATLGMVDHLAAGLADYGNPEGFLERQVSRWMTELDSYSKNEGYPGPSIGGIDKIANWLERNRPQNWRPGIMHGDFHLANVMFASDGPQLAAIVDWEMSTIGDPLLDLGWLLATWPDGSILDTMVRPLAAAGGLAAPADLIAAYRDHSDRDLSAMDWYIVMACFKLGIVLEGTYARACAGKAPKAVGDQLHATALHLLEKAEPLLA